MVLQILLIISIILQLVAAGIAIGLMSKTRFNLSWILFTIALTALSLLRFCEYYQVVADKELRLPPYFFVWMGIVVSLCFAIGMFFVKKIFNYIGRANIQQRITEKRILNTVVRTEEKERMRFSKELHDGLGPLLSSAKMSVSAISTQNLSDDDKQTLENIRYIIDESMRSLREISNNLSPHILKDFGLIKAVQNFTGKCMTLNPTKINFTTNLKSERFDTEHEVILYRVICELINNSIKHSGGTEIELSIIHLNDILTINYSDNGHGFDPEAVADYGMGLSNINSRISSLKGTVQIESSKDNGMTARIEVDLKANAIYAGNR